jgi:nitrite reductase (NADH) small subunit
MSRLRRVELDWPGDNTVLAGDEDYFTLQRGETVHVLASRCPHRGGPLRLGVVSDGRLRCPWHGNTFRVDRLCARGVPAIQRGDRVIAYVPVEDQDTPVAANTLIFAE